MIWANMSEFDEETQASPDFDSPGADSWLLLFKSATGPVSFPGNPGTIWAVKDIEMWGRFPSTSMIVK